ncbi:PE-PGRS family protein [Kitasatospora acidiphila]|uniref:PE-PGRS family protein n=1 Tax=Kitasatospora acidiphila TaxID=2567942 RepID=UPI003C76021E
MTGGRRTELIELLQRAGLDPVGHGRVYDARPVAAAWRPVAAGDTEPTLAFPADHPDLVAELNRQWHQLAVEHGVLGADGEFLVGVAFPDSGYQEWTRVRLTEQWDLAGHLGPKPGEPEFVAMSPDGESVLGTTTEEQAVWLIAVDGFTAWLEASAQARAVEDPQECQALWDRVLQRRPASARLREQWREGLARNAAMPAAVLLRLLDVEESERFPASWLIHRDLDDQVVEAWLSHPEWRVRKALAERWKLTAEQRARLFEDPDPHHRWIFMTCAVDYRMALTEATYDQLAGDPSARVRAELALHPDLPAGQLAALAADPDPKVRCVAAPRAWVALDEPVRAALLADPDPDAEVRAEAVLRQHETTPLSAADFAALPADRYRERATAACLLSRELAESLVRGTDSRTRSIVATNPLIAPELVAVLAADPAHEVRWPVSLRPDLTEEERARIPVEIEPRMRHAPLKWVLAQHHDADAMRRCAASAHVLVRRSVACATNLPADVADRLAHDEDYAVRLLLAEHCAQAPAEVLLEMWQTWQGYSAARLVEHPNFPREHTLSHAEHPNPAMRQLALDDPESTPELVEWFSRDPADAVRRRALRDPRLSAASVIRLLDDPHGGIRSDAAADPRLPVRVLIALLHDPGTATDAARNPAIPEAVLHHLLRRPEAELHKT